MIFATRHRKSTELLMDLMEETGLVFVPATSETTESSCPVMAFTRLDFPAFLLPKKVIQVLIEVGVSLSEISIPLYLTILILTSCCFCVKCSVLSR